VREHFISVNASLEFVRDKDLDNVRSLDSIGNFHDLHAIFACCIPALAGTKADNDIEPAVAQVQGLPASLRSIPDHRDAFAFQHADICIRFIIFF